MQIEIESPDQPEVIALLKALDDYLIPLYPPEDNHILSVEELKAPQICFFVLRDLNQTVQGCGALRVLDKNSGEIKRMMVRPESRGKRYGVALLEAIAEKARSLALRQLVLETGTKQPEALRLYINAGFEFCDPFGEYRKLADAGTSVFMRKTI